jgi:hypothetical protein
MTKTDLVFVTLATCAVGVPWWVGVLWLCGVI